MSQTPRTNGPSGQRITILFVLSVGIFAAAIVTWLTSPEKTEPASVKTQQSHSNTAKIGSASASTVEPQMETADSVGHDGEFASMPPRPTDALIDAPSPETPLEPGTKVRAQVSVNGTTSPELAPNQLGELPRVYLKPRDEANVRLRWEGIQPGDRVVAAVEDGGHFKDGKPVCVMNVNANQEVTFTFVSGEESGIYRINVRHGGECRTVQFWAATDQSLSLNR